MPTVVQDVLHLVTWVEAADSHQRNETEHALRLLPQMEISHLGNISYVTGSETILFLLARVSIITKQPSISKEHLQIRFYYSG